MRQVIDKEAVVNLTNVSRTGLTAVPPSLCRVKYHRDHFDHGHHGDHGDHVDHVEHGDQDSMKSPLSSLCRVKISW